MQSLVMRITSPLHQADLLCTVTSWEPLLPKQESVRQNQTIKNTHQQDKGAKEGKAIH